MSQLYGYSNAIMVKVLWSNYMGIFSYELLCNVSQVSIVMLLTVVLCIANIDVCSKAGLIRCSFLKESVRLALLQLQNDRVMWTMFRGLAHNIWQR